MTQSTVVSAGPETLKEVSARTKEAHKRFLANLNEFLEAFYHDADDLDRQARIADRPEPLADEEMDLWLGATAEHLAQRWKVMIPAWTQERVFLAADTPRFYPSFIKARPLLMVESPPAFRRRLLFTTADPLARQGF